ncbi:MAG TPA: STAS domain-containing protein [Bacteroidota bacterium]
MSEFNILQRETKDINVLEIKGYLDAHTAPKLEDAFQALLKSSRYKIVVNCKELSYISSAGLGVFMAFVEDVRKNKGDIKLSNMSPKVFNIFDLLGFPLLYDILADEGEAISRFLDSKTTLPGNAKK